MARSPRAMLSLGTTIKGRLRNEEKQSGMQLGHATHATWARNGGKQYDWAKGALLSAFGHKPRLRKTLKQQGNE